MEDSELIIKAVQWAKKSGFQKIKANCEEFETPTQYTPKEEGEAFIPDVTGIKMGVKSFVEVAMKTDNERQRISKWKLLSTLAGLKGGKLFLLAPKGHKAFTERIVKDYNLNANVIYFKV